MASELELERERAKAYQARARAHGPTWIERQVQSVAQGAADFFTGNDRIDPADEDVQELPQMRLNAFESDPDLPPGFARASNVRPGMEPGATGPLMGLGAEDKGKIGILENLTGELPKRTDSSGNIIVRITPEKAEELSRRSANPIQAGEYFIDRPGLSWQDLYDNSPEALLGAVLGPAGLIRGGIKRSGAVFAGGAAESVATDTAAEQLGSRDGISGERALMSGAGALGGDMFVRYVVPFLFRSPGLLDRSGNLTEEGKQAVEAMGQDVEKIGPALQAEINKRLRAGADPKSAAVVAEAESLPTPVPLTRGQTSGNPDQRLLETQAEDGVYGDLPRSTMRGMLDDQQRALESNVEAIGEGMSGAPSPSRPGESALQARDTLLAERDAAKAGVDTAFDTARQAKAGIPSDAVQGGSLELRGAIQDFSPRAAPTTHGFVDDLSELGAEAGDGAIPVDRLEAWRRQVTTYANTTNDRTESAAARALVKKYDDMTEEWTKAAIIQGDENALRLWRDAVGKRREMGKLFEAGDIVEFLTKRDRNGDMPSEDEVLKRLFGARGFTPNKEMVKVMRTLRKRLPEDEFNAIRQEAWLRLANQSRGQRQPDGSRPLSGASLMRNLENLRDNNPELWRTMFSEEERGLINRFARTLNRATTIPRGGQNTSGTGAAVAKMVQQIFTLGLVNRNGLKALMAAPLIGDAVKMAYGAKAVATAANAAPGRKGYSPFFVALGDIISEEQTREE